MSPGTKKITEKIRKYFALSENLKINKISRMKVKQW